MKNYKSRIVILGAGPAGLALAMKLLKRSNFNSKILILDLNSYAGGLAASFEKHGLYFDYGSHRLHHACSEEILNDIKSLMGSDLLDRPRNGRIHLLNRFLKFPLNPVDLVRKLPLPFVLKILWDSITKPFIKKNSTNSTFADSLLSGLGNTILMLSISLMPGNFGD